jgi:uncharacterized Fe-S cluster-containing protein
MLPNNKIIKLDKINGWYWEVNKSFDEHYDDLTQWIADNNKIPNKRSNNDAERKLGNFCGTQRKRQKQGKLTDEQIQKLEGIGGWYWEIEDPFDKRYNELKEWIEINNRIPSEGSKNMTEKSFGLFCAHQRQNKKQDKLTVEQIQKLEKIDGWYWVGNSKSFNERYDDLKQWIYENNKIPCERSKNTIEKSLGLFCSRQKQHKKQNKLTDEQIQKFEEINDWFWETENPFDKHCIDLKRWIEINNKMPSETSKDIIEKKLGNFCSHQRQNKRQCKLTDEQIHKLEKINKWYWEMGNSFDENYEKLKQWINNNKKMPSTHSEDEQEKYLGNFCSNQRYKKKIGKLSDEQIKKLETLEKWFWSSEEIKVFKTFDENYEELKQWIDTNNKIPSYGSKNEIEKNLGSVCSVLRTRMKKGQLSDEQVKKLGKINKWYWEMEDSFNEHYDDLKQWVETNNKMPRMKTEDTIEKSLGIFCSHQRQNRKKNKLSDEQIKKLGEIDGWYWEVEGSFDRHYDDLKQWVETNDTIPNTKSVDTIEKNLGTFCANQRQNKKKGKLTDDEIQKLEKIDGWFWEAVDPFGDNYDKLKQWVTLNKKIPSSASKNEVERKIGNFCADKRKYKKKNKVSDEQIKKLEEIPGWFW